MTACRRWLVSGRVQGVFFRASTRRCAQALGLTGVARNLADGRVEVIACGSVQALDRLAAWLQQGPSAAEVTSVEATTYDGAAPAGFTTE